MSAFGLYIHLPFCRTKCAYCDFAVVVGRDRRRADYVAALIREMRGWGHALGRPAVPTIYFGGGTPSLLAPEQIAAILDVCREAFAVAADAEISLEANPSTADRASFRALRDAGVTRLSLGVQSFDDAELRFLGRQHCADDGRRAVEEARAAGFTNLSLDLIYGLPGQELASWQRTLAAAAALAPEHLSVYGLTIEPATELGRQRRRGLLPPPDDDLAAAMYELSDEILGASGYQRYEIANFARPGFACQHNLRYWRNQPFLGVGMGAHSSTVVARFANHRRLNAYLAGMSTWEAPQFAASCIPEAHGPIAWVETLPRETQLAETVILGLRLTDGLDLDAFAARFGERAETRWAATLAELEAAGLATVTAGALRLTPRGRLLADEVFTRFLLER
ncbi:MAG: radical SAM family heme chaperone HemW [Chloroflexota bacterium]|nr:radical SAM family heme chaperone HemW [Dehalococcoidia bacterium]MDW8253019.1 radical SAM family heme chaperone HemW [Chloroflexota bacterium]